MDSPHTRRDVPDQPPAPRVIIPADLAGVLLSYLYEAGDHERGGVLLGHRDEAVTWVSMAFFPPQLQRDRLACSFDVGCLNVIHATKAKLAGEFAAQLGVIVGWIHSHPKLGLFMSPTDIRTLSAWQQLDPKAVAVVADPYERGHMHERLAWWRGPGRGQYVTLDRSGATVLTFRQIAEVAEALYQSAGSGSRWDIVASPTVMQIMARSGNAEARPPVQNPSGGPAQDPWRNRGQGPRGDW
jgi:proteasome lid subunit RPN8/RPN11